MKKLSPKGFTIIELLIATVTFSLILLVITGAIIQFSRLYYKGVASNKTQEVARSIADEMSRAAQFSTQQPTSVGNLNNGAWCIGDKRFSYALDTFPNSSQGALVVSTGPCARDMTLSLANRELIGENMKLLKLDVTSTADKRVTVKVVVGYGSDVTPANPQCRAISLGGQFCAVSTIESTVTRRL